tara:strand:- start:1520 stop:2257 length:738 start_codon:yes stop_codon:yes gene_type:complete
MKPHHFIADLLGYKLVKKRNVDRSLTQHLMHLLNRCRINCVIDVGANVGQYGSLLRGGGYGGRIVSFEPAEEPFSKLKKISEEDSNWLALQMGLSSKPESKVLHRMESSAFSSFHRPNEYGAKRFNTVMKILGTESVNVSTLTQVWSTIIAGIPEPRVFLKMDTQGHDLEIFRGARNVLGHVYGLQAEMSLKPIYQGTPNIIEMLTEFCRQGFEITGFYPLTREKDSHAIIESDCILQRQGAASK